MDHSNKLQLPERRRLSKPPRGTASAVGPPVLLLLILGALFSSILVPGRLLGYNLSGWLWVLILVASLFMLLRHADQVSFPVWLWLPWVAYVLFRTDWSDMLALQSTAQILCAVVVGMAASTHAISTALIAQTHRWLRYGFCVFAALFVFRVLPWTLKDIDNLGFATGAITSLIFQSYFLCCYLVAGRRRNDLLCYLAAAAMPVLCANRGPIAGAIAGCLLVVAPLSLARRVVIGSLAILLALAAFYSPKIQHKMFFSGQGTLADVRVDNPDFNWSGRQALWELLEEGFAEEPWFGHGGNADARLLLSRSAETYALHNDWYRIRYNYGLLGMILMATTLTLQVGSAYLWSKRNSPRVRSLALTGATCFVPFAVVMYSDNILVYCQYFTAPHFFILGFAYAAAKWEKQHPETQLAPVPLTSPLPAGRADLRRRMTRPFRRPIRGPAATLPNSQRPNDPPAASSS